MPYISCPGCRQEFYSASGYRAYERCPRCDERLAVGSAEPREAAPRGGKEREEAVQSLVELQQKTAARLRHGGTLADVTREIIDPSPLSEAQRNALWPYAASQPGCARTLEAVTRRAEVTP